MIVLESPTATMLQGHCYAPARIRWRHNDVNQNYPPPPSFMPDYEVDMHLSLSTRDAVFPNRSHGQLYLQRSGCGGVVTVRRTDDSCDLLLRIDATTTASSMLDQIVHWLYGVPITRD